MPMSPRSKRFALPSLAAVAAVLTSAPAHAVDGVLKAWGRNTAGQTTIPVGIGKVKYAAGGVGFSLAIKSDGTVVAFGDNAANQTTLPSDLGKAIRVAAGSQHGLAILENNSIRGWGNNLSGQITIPVDLLSAKEIAAGGLHSMALTSANAVRCWGDNTDGQCTVPVGLGTAKAIGAGTGFSIAIKSDGTLFAWGSNAQGQTTVPGDLGTASSAAAGSAHVVVLTELGEVRCFGDNASNQCVPPGGLTNVYAVAAGGNSSFALRKNGTVVGWGDNADAQTTIPGTLQQSSFIAAGGSHVLAIEADPTDCNSNGTRDELEIRDDPDLDCTGDGRIDSCTDESVQQSASQVAPFGSASTASLTINNSPTPLDKVEVSIEVRADLGSSLEYLILSINDTVVDYLFNVGGIDCTSTSQKAKVLIPSADYVALLDDDRRAVFRIRASPFVSAAECPSGYVNFSVRFRTDVADCNDNGTPDACELADGLINDDNDNGIPDTCERFTKGDHDGDLNADFVTFNPANRLISVRYLDGVSVLDADALEKPVGSGWVPAIQADFDGDRRPDFLLRNTQTGKNVIWLMDGTTVAAAAETGYALPSNVTLLAATDLDGDGDDDLVWLSNSDNKVYFWRMAGVLRVGGGLLSDATGSYFLGAGDIDGDGDGDLLFRGTASRRTVAWVIQNAAVQSKTPIAGGSLLGPEWEGRGVADASGDGKADLFIRNRDTGALFCWYLNGPTRTEGGQVGTYSPGTGIDVAAILDIDGDETVDVLWKEVNGNRVFGWILNGRTFVSGGQLTTLQNGVTIIRQ